MIKIPFNKPPITGFEEAYVLEAMHSEKISGDGLYCRKCEAWFERELGCGKAFMTSSCTQALEMCALLLGIQPDDEVIMPSYTFVSTANAFVLRGAKIVFVDIRADTMNIDESLVEAAITEKTRAIIAVHYSGVGCEMQTLETLADKYGVTLIEDAAQGIGASYRGRKLGSFGRMSAFSFHETKNCTSGGEGGMLVLNDPDLIESAEILREKGTNRMQFFRGERRKYEWIDVGSSFLACELQAAFLYAQLEHLQELNEARRMKWEFYNESFQHLATEGKVELPDIPSHCNHNAHIFFLKLQDEEQRSRLIAKLSQAGVLAVFHYVPLHSSPGGQRYGYFHGKDIHTTKESLRLLRLPIWHGLDWSSLRLIRQVVEDFFR